MSSAGEWFSLQGETALVTGASRGIGASIARRLAKAGAKVLLNYRSNESLAEKVLAEIKADSPESELLAFDVADAKNCEEVLTEAQKRHEISILVCNAGIARDQLLPRSSAEHFEEVLKTNLLGAIHPVRVLSRSMMRNRKGRIVLMSSVVGQMGNKGQSAYAASKSGLAGFCKSVAKELGSRNVTCNLIAPGFIETEMTGDLPQEVQDFYRANIPLQRFGSPEEVASTVHFLVSREAGYITGSCVDVNGGLLML